MNSSSRIVAPTSDTLSGSETDTPVRNGSRSIASSSMVSLTDSIANADDVFSFEHIDATVIPDSDTQALRALIKQLEDERDNFGVHLTKVENAARHDRQKLARKVAEIQDKLLQAQLQNANLLSQVEKLEIENSEKDQLLMQQQNEIREFAAKMDSESNDDHETEAIRNIHEDLSKSQTEKISQMQQEFEHAQRQLINTTNQKLELASREVITEREKRATWELHEKMMSTQIELLKKDKLELERLVASLRSDIKTTIRQQSISSEDHGNDTAEIEIAALTADLQTEREQRQLAEEKCEQYRQSQDALIGMLMTYAHDVDLYFSVANQAGTTSSEQDRYLSPRYFTLPLDLEVFSYLKGPASRQWMSTALSTSLLALCPRLRCLCGLTCLLM